MRGQVKHEISQEDFNKLLSDNPGLQKLESGVYIQPERMAGGTWNRPVAAKIGDKFYVMRTA